MFAIAKLVRMPIVVGPENVNKLFCKNLQVGAKEKSRNGL